MRSYIKKSKKFYKQKGEEFLKAKQELIELIEESKLLIENKLLCRN